MKTATLISAASLLVLLQGCTTIKDVTEVHDGGRYRPGDAQAARAGEVMMDRFRYSAAPVARPVRAIPAASGRLEVPANYRLVARRVDGLVAYCTTITSSFACFYDDDGDKVFDHVLVSNAGIASSKQPLDVKAAYTLGESSSASGFKSELLYQGRAGNDLNLLYRDYTDDLSRPSYEQPLHYALNASGQADVTFRDAKIKVLAADDTGIRYEILHGFSD